MVSNSLVVLGKDKGHPITHPEGEYKPRSTFYLASAIDGVGGQRHAPAALPTGWKRGTHCTGGWMGPRTGLEGYGISRPYRNSTPYTIHLLRESLYRLSYRGSLVAASSQRNLPLRASQSAFDISVRLNCPEHYVGLSSSKVS